MDFVRTNAGFCENVSTVVLCLIVEFPIYIFSFKLCLLKKTMERWSDLFYQHIIEIVMFWQVLHLYHSLNNTYCSYLEFCRHFLKILERLTNPRMSSSLRLGVHLWYLYTIVQLKKKIKNRSSRVTR